MNIIKPPKLNIGDTIGIIAPSLPVLPSLRENYEKGKKVLTDLGFKIKEGETIKLQHWWAAGTPKQQATDINKMFADPEVKAIMAHAGGHSAISALEYIDYELIKKNPKPFIGMSDITVYHLAFLTKSNLVGFHMDDVTFGMGWNWQKGEEKQEQFEKEAFIKFLTKSEPPGIIEPLSDWECLRKGQAEGHLIGGNLHLLCNQIGSPYFPPLEYFDGAILFIEDVGEQLYNIARSLYQLKYLRIFERISGLLIGKITDIKPSDKGIKDPSLKELFLEIFNDYNFPILGNMDFGHYTVNIPMPEGIKIRFSAENKILEFLEPAVI